MYLPWDTSLVPNYQPIYYSFKTWKYFPIRGKHNDWVIMDFIDKGKNEEEYKSVKK